jgi:hypothetical protein
MLLRAQVDTREVPDVLMHDIVTVASKHPGNDVLELLVVSANGSRSFQLNRTVDAWDPALRRELQRLLGGEVEL